MPFHPLSDTVVVQLEGSAPDPAQPGRRHVQTGRALEVAPGAGVDAHAAGRITVQCGDTVFFSEDAGLILDGGEGVRLLVRGRDILAIDRAEEADEVPLWVPPPPRTH